MPILNEREYAKLANAAAKDLVDHQIPLNESLDKLASSYGMNDDQLARLCEATNNEAFNAMFAAKGKQGSEDRMVDFPLASPKAILEKRLGAEKTAHVVAASSFDAVHESRPLRSASIEIVESEKVAEALPSVSQLRRYEQQDERTLDKALEHLRSEKIAADYRATEALSCVAQVFRPLYSRDGFPQFEKEAMRLHGAEADPLLDTVRSALRMSEVTRDYQKVAHLVVSDETTAAHTYFKQAVDAHKRTAQIETTLKRYGRG